VVSIATAAKATNGATSNKTNTVTYGATGNILTRSDVGTYSYAATASGCAGLTGARISAPGPHALSAISGIKNVGYCYDDLFRLRSAAGRDARGNMIAGDGRSVTWSAFDMVTSVSRGGSVASFDYGPDRQRFRRIDATPAGTQVRPRRSRPAPPLAPRQGCRPDPLGGAPSEPPVFFL
jgi:hypothetical protein